jgi:hypothetical protein
MEMKDVPLSDLPYGLESSEKLKIPGYKIGIPVREIYGTIVSERFEENLAFKLFEKNKKYDVREICAFRESEDIVWRFHITIFEDKQHEMIKGFFQKLSNGEE